MLEVILQNPCRQRWVDLSAISGNRAYDLSTANHFSRGKSGDFCRQHKVNLKLRVGLQLFIRLKQHSGAADIFGCAFVPHRFAEPAITQRKV